MGNTPKCISYTVDTHINMEFSGSGIRTLGQMLVTQEYSLCRGFQVFFFNMEEIRNEMLQGNGMLQNKREV